MEIFLNAECRKEITAALKIIHHFFFIHQRNFIQYRFEKLKIFAIFSLFSQFSHFFYFIFLCLCGDVWIETFFAKKNYKYEKNRKNSNQSAQKKNLCNLKSLLGNVIKFSPLFHSTQLCGDDL